MESVCGFMVIFSLYYHTGVWCPCISVLVDLRWYVAFKWTCRILHHCQVIPSLNSFTLCTSLMNPSHIHVVILCDALALAYVYDNFFSTPFFFALSKFHLLTVHFHIASGKYEISTVHINQSMVSGFAIFFKLAALLESEENWPHCFALWWGLFVCGAVAVAGHWV